MVASFLLGASRPVAGYLGQISVFGSRNRCSQPSTSKERDGMACSQGAGLYLYQLDF